VRTSEARHDEPVVPRRLWLATLVLGALLWAAVAVAIALTGLIGLVGAVPRWRRFRIERWTEAHPRTAPARAIAGR